MKSALRGIRILDLTRVLAGPVCTQILGDLGADVIKIERPGSGDDTRAWGPPYLKDAAGNDTAESAYYLSCNRGKRSIAIDITKPGGQQLILRLLGHCDVLIENFKTGGLEKYGLDYEQLRTAHPRLIYCSITGFGRNGPLACEPGYDFLAQAMSGFMAATGAPGGAPVKAGVAISDIMTGLYAAIGILAALQARQTTDAGQLVDVALTDCMLAGMTNIAQYYLTGGSLAPRVGNAHATIVPYEAFAAADGHLVIAVGNDGQFRRLCGVLDTDWAAEARFATNAARLQNRAELSAAIAGRIARKTAAEWVALFEAADVPAAPVQTVAQAFTHPQTMAREMEIAMTHPASPAPVKLVGSPLKLSGTPVSYTLPPPLCGQHTGEVLAELLGLNEAEIAALRNAAVIAG